FSQSISFYNIENGNNSNKDVEVKCNNENVTKPEKSSYLQEVFLKSTYGKFELKVKEDIEINEETIQTRNGKIKSKEEIEIYELSKAFTQESYQYSQCDNDVSQTSTIIKYHRKHTGKRDYRCSQCDKDFSQNSSLVRHQRTHTEEKPHTLEKPYQ
ncbi:unnamed protein product, partial [Meganyctiphanes norvegica]